MPDRHLGVVVGVDGSPSALVAASWAARDAELRNVTLTLVHAMRDTGPTWLVSALARLVNQPPLRRAHRILDTAVGVVDDSCRAGGPAKVITKVALSDPVSALLDASGDADLVVVGARGAGAVRRALHGSVGSVLVQRSDCPVAIIHDEDPLMPHPVQAPVLLGVSTDVASTSAWRAAAVARREADRRGVGIIEVPITGPSVDRLLEQSESAQLVVVGDRAVGAALARSGRMPVIIVR